MGVEDSPPKWPNGRAITDCDLEVVQPFWKASRAVQWDTPSVDRASYAGKINSRKLSRLPHVPPQEQPMDVLNMHCCHSCVFASRAGQNHPLLHVVHVDWPLLAVPENVLAPQSYTCVLCLNWESCR